MLKWTLEHVSSSSISTVYIETDALVNNHAIEGLQTFGELFCDTMRLKKTPTAYLFMCIYALWAYTHMKIHWPILLLCLSDVMIDQCREMRERFLKLTIVLAYGDKSESLIASKLNWINVSTFKGTLQNFTEWSSAISYMWDITDPQAFKVVLLTSYDMWTTHTVKMRKKTQLISEGFKEIQIPYSDWSEMVALIVMNKGHHLRNLKIRAHVSVWPLYWYEALLMIWWQNIAELIELLWSQAKKALYSAGVKDYLYKVLATGSFMFEKVSENSDLTLHYNFAYCILSC